MSIRNKVSKIIPADEVGKVFSLCSTIEATMPFIGSIIYTNIFALSIATMPGMIYQFGALVILLALCVYVFEELYCNRNAENSTSSEVETA